MVSIPGVSVSYEPMKTQPLSKLVAKNGWYDSTDPSGPPPGWTPGGTKAEFSQVAKTTPAEQMRGAMLDKLGLAEDQLASMGTEKRKAFEDRLKEMVKQMAEADPTMSAQIGLIADIKA